MAAIAVLAVVFAVLRLPFGLPVVWVGGMTAGAAIAYRRGRSGFLGGIAVGATGTLGLGIYQRLTHQYVFDSSTGPGPTVTMILLAVYVAAGAVQGTLASFPVWLIASVHRAERERQEAREAMAVQGDREGDHPS